MVTVTLPSGTLGVDGKPVGMLWEVPITAGGSELVVYPDERVLRAGETVAATYSRGAWTFYAGRPRVRERRRAQWKEERARYWRGR